MQKRTTIELDTTESDFVRFYTSLATSCIKGTLVIGFSACVLILFNAMLILGFSNAINNATHNMTSGCLWCETEPCTTRITFYERTSLVTLFFWSAILFANEVFVCSIIVAFVLLALRYINRLYDTYRLTILQEFPDTQTIDLDGTSITTSEEDSKEL